MLNRVNFLYEARKIFVISKINLTRLQMILASAICAIILWLLLKIAHKFVFIFSRAFNCNCYGNHCQFETIIDCFSLLEGKILCTFNKFLFAKISLFARGLKKRWGGLICFNSWLWNYLFNFLLIFFMHLQ